MLVEVPWAAADTELETAEADWPETAVLADEADAELVLEAVEELAEVVDAWVVADVEAWTVTLAVCESGQFLATKRNGPNENVHL